MTDITPEGKPLTEYDHCPDSAALAASGWRTCLYGPLESGSAAAFPTTNYWFITNARERESP